MWWTYRGRSLRAAALSKQSMQVAQRFCCTFAGSCCGYEGMETLTVVLMRQTFDQDRLHLLHLCFCLAGGRKLSSVKIWSIRAEVFLSVEQRPLACLSWRRAHAQMGLNVKPPLRFADLPLHPTGCNACACATEIISGPPHLYLMSCPNTKAWVRVVQLWHSVLFW